MAICRWMLLILPLKRNLQTVLALPKVSLTRRSLRPKPLSAWSKTAVDERKALVLKIADVIEANATELVQLLTKEQGKPLEAATVEVYGMAAFCRYFTSLDLPVEVLEDSDARRVEVHRNPLGVVGAIVPWNFPLLLMAFKLPPALIAGNTMVIKPAPTTPLSTLRLAELISEIVPAGVVNFITDANDLGAPMTAHPDVRKSPLQDQPRQVPR